MYLNKRLHQGPSALPFRKSWPVENDTLYLSADTMMAVESQLAEKKRLLAWGGVRIFKEDLQGRADSLAYKLADSVLFFYREPVLWSDANQLTGDTISMQIKNNQVDRLRLLQNGFVISRDTVINQYNQVKGRLITAFFSNDELKQIAVNGNGESIYFVLDEKQANVLMGMNRLTCSNMLISFGNKTVQQIRFYQQPDAVFVPPHELQEPETRLAGFRWLDEYRPSKASVISRQPLAAQEVPKATTGAPEGVGTGKPATGPVKPATSAPLNNGQKPTTSPGQQSDPKPKTIPQNSPLRPRKVKDGADNSSLNK